ncbi:CFDP1 family protein [Megaselia abdita]
MNNPEDYASDTDDSDCDFDPKAHVSHGESEEEEDDIVEKVTKNSRKKVNEEPKSEPETKEEIPEVDGKKADDLWASFQSDVKEKEPATSNGSSSPPVASATSSNSVKKPAQTLPQRKPPTFPSALKRPAGGLGNILGQLGKKNKLSVLEQSKKDWNSFKDEEGLNEELNTFNKGKDG